MKNSILLLSTFVVLVCLNSQQISSAFEIEQVPEPPRLPEPSPAPDPIQLPEPSPAPDPFPTESDSEKIKRLTRENNNLQQQNNNLQQQNSNLQKQIASTNNEKLKLQTEIIELNDSIQSLKDIASEQIRVIMQLVNQLKNVIYEIVF